MARGAITPPGPSLWPDCGTRTAYQRHCDTGEPACARCRAKVRHGAADYRKRRYLHGPRKISALGTQRRLQALHAIGWTAEVIGSRLTPPVTDGAIQMTLQRPLIYRDRAAQIAALYDQLWDTPGPSVKTRARAAAKGWPPPMAWDDDRMDDPGHVPLEIVLRDWDLALEINRKRRGSRKSYAKTGRVLVADQAVSEVEEYLVA